MGINLTPLMRPYRGMPIDRFFSRLRDEQYSGLSMFQIAESITVQAKFKKGLLHCSHQHAWYEIYGPGRLRLAWALNGQILVIDDFHKNSRRILDAQSGHLVPTRAAIDFKKWPGFRITGNRTALTPPRPTL